MRPQTVRIYSTAQGLVDHNAYAVLEDRAGAIWIGAWERGVSRIENGRITNFTTADGLVNGLVMALAEDRNGRIWISARDARNGGLAMLENGRITRVAEPIVPDGAFVAAIHQARDGAMWFGTTHGLVRYADGVARTYTTADGLAGDDVRVIIDGGAGRLWIGTYGGLSLFEDGRFTSWTERDGLSSNSVRALYLDRDDGAVDRHLRWWAEPLRQPAGSLRLHRQERPLQQRRVPDSRRRRRQVLDDLESRHPSGCQGATERLRRRHADRRELVVIRQERRHAQRRMQRRRSGPPAFAPGTAACGCRPRTASRSSIRRPSRATSPAPVVKIESVAVDGAVVTTAPAVRLAPAQENLEIRYTGLTFVNAERMVFSYQLHGVDRDWVYAGTRRLAHYAHVPPGRYTFSVLAANSDGVWATTPATLEVVVMPPYWRTAGFSSAASASARPARGVRLPAARRDPAPRHRDGSRSSPAN